MWQKQESWTVYYSGESLWGDPVSGSLSFDTLEAAEQYIKTELEQDDGHMDYFSLVARTSYTREEAKVCGDIL